MPGDLSSSTRIEVQKKNDRQLRDSERPMPFGTEVPMRLEMSQNPFEQSDDSLIDRRRSLGPELFDEIRRLQPETALQRLVGKGAENLVFEVDGRDRPDGAREVVVKVNAAKTLEHAMPRLMDPGITLEEQEGRMRREMDLVDKDFRELRAYFGKESVPAQVSRVRALPVSRKAVDAFFGKSIAADVRFPDRIPGWVTIQERIDMPGPEDVVLRGYYPESPTRERKLAPGVSPRFSYIEGHDLLVGRVPAVSDVEGVRLSRERDVDAVLNMYPYLRDVAGTVRRDPAFVACLRDFVRKAVAYATETGKALDFAGKDNIFMEKTSDGWRVRMPDAMSPDGRNGLLDLEEASAALLAGRDYDVERGTAVLNALNSVRVTNALAILADLPDRVWVPRLDEVQASRWLEDIKRDHFPSRPSPSPSTVVTEEATKRERKSPA